MTEWLEDDAAQVFDDRIVMGDGDVIYLDRDNARVFMRPGWHEIIWPQPDGTCWIETRSVVNRASRRRGVRPVSRFDRPEPSRS